LVYILLLAIEKDFISLKLKVKKRKAESEKFEIMIPINSLATLAKNAETNNKAFFKNIKPKQSHNTDELFHKINDEVFSKINCLECANCCKTLEPRFSERDISRISKKMNIKPFGL